MKSFLKKDYLLKIREDALKKNLKKRKKFKIKIKKKKRKFYQINGLKKLLRKGGSDLLLINNSEEEKSLMAFHHMDMMQEFQVNLKFLPMLTLELLILKFSKKRALLQKLGKNV